MLDIAVDRVSELPVLRLAGSLVLGPPAESLKVAVDRLVADRRPTMIVDLSGIGAVDSTGITALVAAHDTVHRAGGRLVLVRLTARLRTLLQTTRLVAMFEIADDEAAAVQALAAGHGPG